MGNVNLALIPVDVEEIDYWSGYTSLTITHSDKLYKLLENLGHRFTLSVPLNCSFGEDHGFGPAMLDYYKNPLQYMTVEKLLEIEDDVMSMKIARQMAAWGYLSYLPFATKVVLFWY